MKKILVRLFILLVILLVVAAVGVHLFLDSAVKKAVEIAGPQIMKVPVKLDSVSISLLSGSGKIQGLVVGNPEGYKTPQAISVGAASLALQPASLLADKIVVDSINLQAPEITFETDLRHNNLSKLLDNLGGTSETKKEPTQPTETKPAKKLEVDDFVIQNARLHVSVTTLGSQSATVPLPEIHLRDLGKGPDGITPAELTKRVLTEIEASASKAAVKTIEDLSKGAVFMGGEAGKTATNALDKATHNIGDLFKKKK